MREGFRQVRVPELKSGIVRKPDVPDFVPFADATYSGDGWVTILVPEPSQFFDGNRYEDLVVWLGQQPATN